MFTGIVEEIGTVVSVQSRERSAIIEIEVSKTGQGTDVGDSLAVNGCCLTVVGREEISRDAHVGGVILRFDVVPETMVRTNLGDLRDGDPVNLERPLKADGRFGGHIVQGHVDGVGRIREVKDAENARIMEITFPSALRRYIVEKGSICVDGVSLTVASVAPDSFTVWLIPHTCEATTLGKGQPGHRVNLECDLIGKYVERLLMDVLPDYVKSFEKGC
ncbi:riboflavin synthase [Chthonomonas calidirosea]|uniref:Riboflavin synthase n=1 Tax=Chthonomonas calidirosea (strain DSM 23976 / ICMP 18418 / T49) TaxID=1303518 RepID=S0EUU7_CHTCT|nr:riboflavin synthase [Chthonomonas calidirosea]CCW34122.1 riboflavin synthase alpha chain [Chthonomonas calidirosea T49]CEK14542.1 riboflavin synthase alpha chain [Chthonomonas calidirosea]CEK15696.1 riboflavin synthase alpha chain [Chthonomonas calidirosea]